MCLKINYDFSWFDFKVIFHDCETNSTLLFYWVASEIVLVRTLNLREFHRLNVQQCYKRVSSSHTSVFMWQLHISKWWTLQCVTKLDSIEVHKCVLDPKVYGITFKIQLNMPHLLIFLAVICPIIIIQDILHILIHL